MILQSFSLISATSLLLVKDYSWSLIPASFDTFMSLSFNDFFPPISSLIFTSCDLIRLFIFSVYLTNSSLYIRTFSKARSYRFYLFSSSNSVFIEHYLSTSSNYSFLGVSYSWEIIFIVLSSSSDDWMYFDIHFLSYLSRTGKKFLAYLVLYFYSTLMTSSALSFNFWALPNSFFTVF